MFKKYKYTKYNKKSGILFNRERIKLKRILNKDAEIRHIGSTAVPGLGGKGIIDIFVAVKKKDLKLSNKKLQKAGYRFIPSAGGKEREYFEKQYNYKKETRKVHIHLTFHGSFEFKRAIAFTTHLKKHPESVKEYSKVKREAVKYCKGEGKKYRKMKKKILQKICKLALKEDKSK